MIRNIILELSALMGTQRTLCYVQSIFNHNIMKNIKRSNCNKIILKIWVGNSSDIRLCFNLIQGSYETYLSEIENKILYFVSGEISFIKVNLR